MSDYTLDHGPGVRERMDLLAAGPALPSLAELKDFTADPTTLFSAPRVVHAWGVRG